jgi:hypothetical protein
MNKVQITPAAILLLLATFMALTRFNHFGSAISLPDASLAIFFLGGTYLSRYVRASSAFVLLILEAVLIDYYATSVQGVSDWCMTPAYWFLIPTYGSLWFVGRWFALRHAAEGLMESKTLIGLILAAWAANSFAFIFSNATFFIFSERFGEMSAVEYTSRVAQYYVSYVSVALLYIACVAAMHMAIDMISKQRAHLQ